MTALWSICPRCKTGPAAPEIPGKRRKVTLACAVCRNEYSGSVLDTRDPSSRPNYLAMADALRPLVADLWGLWVQLTAPGRSEADYTLAATLHEAATAADDSARLQWLRQEARYALGLDERPYAGLKGRMMEPEAANMRELIAARPQATVAPSRPRPVRVYTERRMACPDHGAMTITDSGVVKGHTFRCPRCDAPMTTMEEE